MSAPGFEAVVIELANDVARLERQLGEQQNTVLFYCDLLDRERDRVKELRDACHQKQEQLDGVTADIQKLRDTLTDWRRSRQGWKRMLDEAQRNGQRHRDEVERLQLALAKAKEEVAYQSWVALTRAALLDVRDSELAEHAEERNTNEFWADGMRVGKAVGFKNGVEAAAKRCESAAEAEGMTAFCRRVHLWQAMDIRALAQPAATGEGDKS